jgi:hypothetical protein
MPKIKNISGKSIGFSGYPAFDIDEVREVTESELEFFKSSPWIEVIEDGKKEEKTNKKFKGVEPENDAV